MAATFLMTARHVEAQYINVASNSIGTTMWVLIAINDMSRFNYVVNTVYNLYVAFRGSVIWTRRYHISQELDDKDSKNSCTKPAKVE
jgi:nicotinamide riboside transporter PnuC